MDDFFATPIAAPTAATPMAAAATTPFDGFDLELVEVDALEVDALGLEGAGADFAELVWGFALTLPEDLAGAGADTDFLAGA